MKAHNGNGTLHGVGMTAAVSLKTQQVVIMKQMYVTSKDVGKVGRIIVRY